MLHMTDCHAQLKPIYFREPSINLGVGDDERAAAALHRRRLSQALRHRRRHRRRPMRSRRQDFAALAKTYGRVGGMDRMATLIKAIRAERGADRVLLLDGGDTLHGSYTALQSKGADMVARDRCARRRGDHRALGIHARRRAHHRAVRRQGQAGPGQGRVSRRQHPSTTSSRSRCSSRRKMFEKGGVKIAVIGQAFPFTPIANPRWMMPKWSFGIREDDVRKAVAAARAARRRGRRPALAQRLRRRSQAGGARRRHRRHPDRAHARCPAASPSGSAPRC